MTDEEIEKQAEEYANKKLDKRVYCSCCQNPDVKQAFQDGAKWGMEHEWHDLRKCPNDLPKRNGIYLICATFSEDIKTYSVEYYSGRFSKFLNVIAWCDKDYVEKLEKELAESKAQIEKMKDCSNCKHWEYSQRSLSYWCKVTNKLSDSEVTCNHCDKWELAE